MDTPPVISQPPQSPPTSKPFAAQAAQASLVAPLAAVGLSIIVNIGRGSQTLPTVKIITGSVSILLIVVGFIFGIVALMGIRWHGSRGILGRALAGVCINGFLIAVMLISIPALMKAMQRAKQVEQQRIEQQQAPP